MSNAARYTAPGGSVRIETGARAGRAFVRIEDSGRGFTPEQRERMFEMFSRSSDSPGLGIGLALASQLARLHNGRIDAESAGPGQGAAFTFSMPVSVRPEAGNSTPMPLDAPNPVSVLVVDDNVDAAETLRALLELQGHEVSVAENGFEALEVFAKVHPTLVLLDIGMPCMDGYEVARRLRAAHRDRTFRIVALSGWGQDRVVERGRSAGFDDYLLKPVEPETLARTLAFADRA